MLTGKWLTLEEASKITGYTSGHLRRLLRDGQVVGTKIGERAWLVDLDSAKKLSQKPYVFGRPKKSSQNDD